MKPAKYLGAVRSALQTEPLTAKELATKTGYSLSVVYSGLKTLCFRGEVERLGLWRSRYKLKDGVKVTA